VRLNPNSPQARRYLAYALIKKGDPTAAEEQLLVAQVLGLDESRDRLILAKAFLNCGMQPKAVSLLRHHVRYHAGDTDAAILLADALASGNRPDEAREVCVQALKNSTSQDAFARLKKKYMELNEAPARSITDASRDIPASLGS